MCEDVCTRILATEPEIERSENKLGKDDSLFNSTHEQRENQSQNNKLYTLRNIANTIFWGGG